MENHITYEGVLDNIDDFYANLTSFLTASMEDGLVSMEGKTVYGSLKNEVRATEETLREALEINPELARKFSFYLELRQDLEEKKTKRAYFLGHRDSGRIRALLWPREIPTSN